MPCRLPEIDCWEKMKLALIFVIDIWLEVNIKGIMMSRRMFLNTAGGASLYTTQERANCSERYHGGLPGADNIDTIWRRFSLASVMAWPLPNSFR
jgi:hypothetical protein